jgi:hypothetical protein
LPQNVLQKTGAEKEVFRGSLSLFHMVFIFAFPVFMDLKKDGIVKLNYFFFWPKKFSITSVAEFKTYSRALGISRIVFRDGSSLILWTNSLSGESDELLRKTLSRE